VSKSADSTTTTTASTSKRPRRVRTVAHVQTANAAGDAASELAHGPLEVEHINYAPAIAAIDDLFTWALDLAMQNVVDWPEGKRRVKSARRVLGTLMRGKAARGGAADEDVAFTAALLVRILDADLGLGLGAIAAIFDELGLPSDHVPRAPSTPRASAGPSIPPASLRHLRAIYAALTPTEADAAHVEALSMSPAERARWAQGLSNLPVTAAVALVRSYLFGGDAPLAAAPVITADPRVVPLRRPVAVCATCPFRAAA
jgi:hypothetical protein